MTERPVSRMSPAQRRRYQRRLMKIADAAVDKRGPGTNHGQGWGDPYADRKPIVTFNADGNNAFSPGAYHVPSKPGAE